MAEDYCDLCDLPKSQCIHGMPPPPPPAPKVTPTRASRTAKAAGSAGAPRTPRAAAAPRQPAAPKPAAPSRRTDQAAFRPLIVAMLREAGGRLEADEVREDLGQRMAEMLLERDKQTGPNGEPRWWTTARAARKELIDEGLLVQGRPGVWELTEKGWGW